MVPSRVVTLHYTRVNLMLASVVSMCPKWSFRLLAFVSKIAVCLVKLCSLQFFIILKYRISRHVLSCFLRNESILALVDLFATPVELLNSKIDLTYTL